MQLIIMLIIVHYIVSPFIHRYKIFTSYFTKIVIHFVYRNDCSVFVLKYKELWNGTVLTHVIDSVCYVKSV